VIEMTETGAALSYVLWTDGCAAPTNPGPGGWAYIIVHGGAERVGSGGEAWSTNNRMEMLAAIRGLEAIPASSVVQVRSDSTYLIKGATQWMSAWRERGWMTKAKEPVRNQDLWVALDRAMRRHGAVGWQKVKGHAGVVLNERCDRLAAQAALAAAGAIGTA
jgi:ribonuclease HI